MYRYQPANIYQQLGAQEPQQAVPQPSLIQQRIQALQATVTHQQPPPPPPPAAQDAGVLVRYQAGQVQQQQVIPAHQMQSYQQQYPQQQQPIPPPMNHAVSAPPMIQNPQTPHPGAQLQRAPTAASRGRPLPTPMNVKRSETAPVSAQMQMQGRSLSQGPTLPQQLPQGAGFRTMQQAQHQQSQQPLIHGQPPSQLPQQIPQQIPLLQNPLQRAQQQQLPPLPPKSRQDSPSRSRPLPSPTPAPPGAPSNGTRQSGYFPSVQIPSQSSGFGQTPQMQGQTQAKTQPRIPPPNPMQPSPAQLMMMGKSMTEPIPIPPTRSSVLNQGSPSTSPTKSSVLGSSTMSSPPTRQLPSSGNSPMKTPMADRSLPQSQSHSGLPPTSSSHIRLPSFPEPSPNTTPTSTIKLKDPSPKNKGRASPPRFGVGPISMNGSPGSSPGSSPPKGGNLANMFNGNPVKTAPGPGRHGPFPPPQTAQPIPPSQGQPGKPPQKFTPVWKRTLPDVLPPLLPTPPPQGPPSPKREAPPKHPQQQWQAYHEQLEKSKAKPQKEDKKAKKLAKEGGKVREKGKIRDFFSSNRGEGQPASPSRPLSMYVQGQLVQQPPPRPPMQSQKSWEHMHMQQLQRQQSWENAHQRQSSWEYAPQQKQRPVSMVAAGQIPGPPPMVPKHTRPPTASGHSASGSFGGTSYSVSTSDDEDSEYLEAEEGDEDEEVDDGDSEYSYEYVYTYEDEHGRRVEVTMDRPPGEDGVPLPTPPPVLPPPSKPTRSRPPVHHQPDPTPQSFQTSVPSKSSKAQRQQQQHFRSSSSTSQSSSTGISSTPSQPQHQQPRPQRASQSQPVPKTRNAGLVQQSHSTTQSQSQSQSHHRHQRSTSSNLSHPAESYQRTRSPSVASSAHSSSSSSLSSPRAPSPLPESPRLSPMSPLGGFDAFVGPRSTTPMSAASMGEMMSPASSVSSLPMSPQYGIIDLPTRITTAISGLPRPPAMGMTATAPVAINPGESQNRNGGHSETSRPTSSTSNASVSSGGFSSGSWVGVTPGGFGTSPENDDRAGGTIKRGFGPRAGHSRGQSMTMRFAAGEDMSPPRDDLPMKMHAKAEKGKQKDIEAPGESETGWRPSVSPQSRQGNFHPRANDITPTKANVQPQQAFSPTIRHVVPPRPSHIQETPARPQAKTPIKYDYEFNLDDTPPASKPGWNAMRQQQQQVHESPQQQLQRQITMREPRQIESVPVAQSPTRARRELPSTPPGGSPILNAGAMRANRVQSQIFGSPNGRQFSTPEKGRPQSQIVSRYMAPLRDEPDERQPKEPLKRRPSGSRRALPNSPGMGSTRPLSSSSNVSVGTSFASPRSAYSNFSPSSSRTSSPFNAPSIISTCEIESPAPVGGRAKLADIGKLESASEGSVTPPPPFSSEGGRSRGSSLGNRPHQHQQRPPSQSPLPAPVPIPTINIGGVDEAERREQEKVGRRANAPTINIDDSAAPMREHAMPQIPIISIHETGDSRSEKQRDSPRQRPQPKPQQHVPHINVFDVPGISFSGPTNGPEITVSGSNDVSFSSIGGGPMIKVSNPSADGSPRQRIKNAQQSQNHQQRQLPQQGQRRGGLVCGGCGGSIIGRIVSAMNQRWHPNCFKCTVCEELLEHVSSYEAEGKPYCHLDYHENFAPRCYHCKTPIIEERFISLDDAALGRRAYHQQHFFCAECGDPFLTPAIDDPTAATGEINVTGDGDYAASDDVGFTVYRGHPYCEACHVRLRLPKCKRCKRSIRDHEEAVEALGGKWCWKCFVCKRCERPFDNPAFFQRGEDPFCEPCFSIILRNEV